MKLKTRLLVGLTVLTIGLSLPAQEVVSGDASAAAVTEAAPSKLSTAGSWLIGWFKDNTNFFDQKTITVGAGALYNHGHSESAAVGTKDSDNFGAFVDIQFPLDDMGQVSIGPAFAYLNHKFYSASLATRLGTTWHVPVIGDLYTFVEAGPAFNMEHPTELLAQGFAGAIKKWRINTSSQIYVSGAYGKITGETGSIAAFEVAFNHKF